MRSMPRRAVPGWLGWDLAKPMRWLGRPVATLLHRHTVALLGLLLAAGLVASLWNTLQHSHRLIHAQALENTQRYADTLEAARTLYSTEVVEKVLQSDAMRVTYDPAELIEGVPLPATFLIHLGERISADKAGMKVRLFSDYPFHLRADGGPQDDFERAALTALRQQPDLPYSRIETFNGVRALRYAQADVMQPSCVACHNAHPDSPKRDWQVGDVRGVLEITTPLTAITAQTRMAMQNTLLTLGGLFALALGGIGLVVSRLRRTSQELERRVRERTAELAQANLDLAEEQAKAESLLLNVLPPTIAQRLKRGESAISDGFEQVTILFADIVNFTQISSELAPEQVVVWLNRVFSAFDELSETYRLEKIKTIGDAYMVAGGLPQQQDHSIDAVADMALAMVQAMAALEPPQGYRCAIRIGINTGPVVAGVIGTKKFIYDLWGDTVNVASRMESHGAAGKIHVTRAVYEQLCDRYAFQERGRLEVKGKGTLETYWLLGRR